MISFIAAPSSAPQIPRPSARVPKAENPLTPDEERILEAVGHYEVAKLWPLLDEIARDDGVSGREALRRERLELSTVVRRLIRTGSLIGYGRNCLALPGTPKLPTTYCPKRPVTKRPLKLPGSADLAPKPGPQMYSRDHFQNEIVTSKKPVKTQEGDVEKIESAVTPELISAAARELARIPRRPGKVWSGCVDGKRYWRGYPIQRPDGEIRRLFCVNRGRVVLIASDEDIEHFSLQRFFDLFWKSKDVRFLKNQAAALLGKMKCGVREKPSAAKQEAARRNGTMPCRPGKRRGRPPGRRDSGTQRVD
jgi:hypothetical protein